MLSGKRPSECSYCWKMEDAHQLSDRYFKSKSFWAKPFQESILQMSGEENVNPSYLELAFENSCNLRCSYCSVFSSSALVADAQKFGAYKTSDNFNNIEQLGQLNKEKISPEDNPYIKAFWKWLPEIYSDLMVLRVTGGEPLLHKDFDQLLNWIKQKPNKNLLFSVNTNGSVPTEKFDTFLEKLKLIQQNVKRVEVNFSLDTWGAQAEYARAGLDLNQLIINIKKTFKVVRFSKIIILCTYNIFSVENFDEFLTNIMQLKKEALKNGNWLSLGISFLHYPHFLSTEVLGEIQRDKIKDSILFLKQNRLMPWRLNGFSKNERVKLERILASLQQLTQDRRKVVLKDLQIFLTEYDRRSGKSYKPLFPMIADLLDKSTI